MQQQQGVSSVLLCVLVKNKGISPVTSLVAAPLQRRGGRDCKAGRCEELLPGASAALMSQFSADDCSLLMLSWTEAGHRRCSLHHIAPTADAAAFHERVEAMERCASVSAGSNSLETPQEALLAAALALRDELRLTAALHRFVANNRLELSRQRRQGIETAPREVLLGPRLGLSLAPHVAAQLLRVQLATDTRVAAALRK